MYKLLPIECTIEKGEAMLAKSTAFIKKIWSNAPIATLILGLALAATLFFGIRSVAFFLTHPPHSEQTQPVEEWMTPGYIAKSWSVPRRVILRAIDAPNPPPNGPMSLSELAEFREVPVSQIVEEVETAIAGFRPSRNRRTGTPKSAEVPTND